VFWVAGAAARAGVVGAGVGRAVEAAGAAAAGVESVVGLGTGFVPGTLGTRLPAEGVVTTGCAALRSEYSFGLGILRCVILTMLSVRGVVIAARLARE
jgi:hypothetical protein